MTFPFPAFCPSVAAVITYTTWNPADKDSKVTLSGGDLTATVTGAGIGGVRAVKSMVVGGSGKWYWEIAPTSMGTSRVFIGVGKSTATLTDYLGSDANGWGYFSFDGVFYNSGAGSTYSTYTTTDIIGIAFDEGSGKVFIRKNATWQNSGDPAALTGQVATVIGTWFPMVSDGSSNNDTSVFTANFGASAFSNAAPSGFTGLGS